MWTRAELKGRAKDCLRKYYWMAFLASLITSLLAAAFQIAQEVRDRFAVTVNISLENGQTGAGLPQLQERAGQMIRNGNWGMVVAAIVVVLMTSAVVFLLSTVWGAFVGNVVQVGCCRYFMESRARGESAGLGRLFWCFEHGKYLNVVKVMFLRNLFVFLWSLLFIIPGIIKSYQYAMVPYILSENPDMDYRDALDLSRRMMDGEKLNLFVLQWSFIGWELLGALLCLVGVLFVIPYVDATTAELYAILRKGPGAAGGVLPGYGAEQESVYTDYLMY